MSAVRCSYSWATNQDQLRCSLLCAGIVPGLAQTVFFVYPYMYKAMYGRFLLLQLSGGTGIIMLNFLVCMLDLIGRLNSRNADMMLLRLMYGRRTAQVWLLLLHVIYAHQGRIQSAPSHLACIQAMLATKEVSQWRAAEVLARSFAEYTSIVAGGALFSFGHIAGDRMLHGLSILHFP